ncbi:MAG: TylF/MycF/NovP-related O-methyltransferase [Paracoccaceae bacterium]|nr:TylF/MycF/NovP-related O-methyltransferase [Paracoccaceae bacterium]
MPESQGHKFGILESNKFQHRRDAFYEYIESLKKSNPTVEDLIFHSTSYIGHMSLNRILTLSELYKQSLKIGGHIADVGVYKGGSAFLFAKLIKIFESESLTLCHGFDWFKGQIVEEYDSALTETGGYKSNHDDLIRLSQGQQLDNILKIHDIDLRSDVGNFFENNPHIRFKLINMDCGKYDVVKSCLPYFWKKLNKGGIMIFDQYSHEHAPGETLAIHEFMPDIEIRAIQNSWTPTAYTIK